MPEGVNIRVLEAELRRQSKKITPAVEAAIEKRFDSYKEGLMKQFEAHDVTVDLEGGPLGPSKLVKVGDISDRKGSENNTGTARGGNLYSLLGFEDGEEPITELREILEDEIILDDSIKVFTNGAKIKIEKRVIIPAISDIKTRTSNPIWTDRSWIELVERGIPWFQSYLFKSTGFGERSQSGTGIEAKNRVRSKLMPAVPYLSKLLAEFKQKITNTRS